MEDVKQSNSAEQDKAVEEFAKHYAKIVKQALYDIAKRKPSGLSFSSYSKDSILNALRSPESNEKLLRDASIQAYQNSTQYRRMIQYYAFMPTWSYTLSPLGFEGSKNSSAYKKDYFRTTKIIERMNLRHEMSKGTLIALREGVFYGAILSTDTSFYIQKINPDICTLTSISDGAWMYGVDMSRIKEDDLPLYPSYFMQMHDAYKQSGQKIQEVPEQYSFCLKGDESCYYPFPPFASTLSSLYDLENMKDLYQVAEKMANYMLLAMKVPTDANGVPTITLKLMKQYYDHVAANLPPEVGLAMTPTTLEAVKFDRDSSVSSSEDISAAIRNFWEESGTSPLLFGDAANTTAQALLQSIKVDEETAFSLMYQCERLINRHLKNMQGVRKWKINFLPVTWFSLDKNVSYYKEAASLGIPVKGAYASLVNVPPQDLRSMAFLENDVLELPDVLIPLQSTYTQSSDGGRPASADGDLSEEGERSRNKS